MLDKPVLILQHQLPERPAYLSTWLDAHSIPHVTVSAGAGQHFPASIEPYSALAVMGGGMSANDNLISNREAEVLILQAMRLNIPVIGHCLGGQLMSRALGARVSTSPAPEIGWQPIDWEHNDMVTHWFGSEPTAQVIQWHYETFDIPMGAVRLASSAACANQAWSLGPHLAMQFHIEIDRTKVHEWVAQDDAKWAEARLQHTSVQTRDEILAGIDKFLEHHQITANHIYNTWLSANQVL